MGLAGGASGVAGCDTFNWQRISPAPGTGQGTDVDERVEPGDEEGWARDGGADGGRADEERVDAGGEEDAGARAPQHFTVVLQNYAYHPSQLHIRVGDTVTWVNHDPEDHNVCAGAPEAPAGVWSPVLHSSQSWSLTFSAPTTWTYYCRFHPELMFDAHVVVDP